MKSDTYMQLPTSRNNTLGKVGDHAVIIAVLVGPPDKGWLASVVLTTVRRGNRYTWAASGWSALCPVWARRGSSSSFLCWQG